MQRALALAARGRGRVEPNPMVGCVLVRANRIIAEGYHRRFGQDHAEVDALRRATETTTGATAYVTLEPCSHHGKTPPCCDALIKEGVTRVVTAMCDPFSQVSGRGIRRLRSNDIRVDVGLMKAQARVLNQPYLIRLELGRPYVISKWAQSLDGKIATRSGESKWISSDQARSVVHRIRSRMDAVIVGINTVLTDDPMLTARNVSVKRVATRVVFDSRLRIPIKCRLVQSANETPVIIFSTTQAVQHRVKRVLRLESRGVRVVPVRSSGGCVSIPAALRRMAKLNWTNVLVEGGGSLLGTCFDAGVVDEAHVFTSPIVIGGRAAPSGCDGRGVSQLEQAQHPVEVNRRMLGDTQLTTLQFDRLRGG